MWSATSVKRYTTVIIIACQYNAVIPVDQWDRTESVSTM